MVNSRKIIGIFDWSLISPEQFEELCYDILNKNKSLGFSNVNWFKGPSGQRGRDIEAEKVIINIPGKSRVEGWIIQCKHYLHQPVAVSDFSNTILWADHHNPEGILIMTS